MTPGKPRSPAAERNQQPILDVLLREFAGLSDVLEIGSGTGQHAVAFARAMPWLFWQTSDLAENHQGINAWIDDSDAKNIGRPIDLDVLRPQPIAQKFDAVFSANTAHIMSIDAVRAMFTVIGEVVRPGGLFCLYGPFRTDGSFDTESNRRFDESLKAQHPQMGIRDLEDLDRLAENAGLSRCRLYAMPANNQLAVWQKAG